MVIQKMIMSAKKSVYLQSPYFIPDNSYINAIKIAAKSGVDVHLMIPCKPDHPLVYWATYSNASDLLSSGVKFTRMKMDLYILKNVFNR